MLDLRLFETTLLVLCAVLTAMLLAIMWWRIAGERVKALWRGWLKLPLLWKIVLPVVFGAFVLHGSVKRGEVVGEGGEVVGDSCSGRNEGKNSILQLNTMTTTKTPSLLQSSTVSLGLFRTTGFEVDSANKILEFSVAWDDDLFDCTLSRNLFLYSSTNLLERRWTWFNTYSMPEGTNAHTFAVSLSNYNWAFSAFFQFGFDIDSDNDNLKDSYERLCTLTDPADPDSDGDAISDGQEVALGLDPLAPIDPFLDLDGDGLTHKQELEFGSNPLMADSDGDGLDDATELRNGWDPNWPGETNEANAPGGAFTTFDRPFLANVRFENPYQEATVYGVSEGSHTVVLSDMVTRDAHKDIASTVSNNIITVTTLDPKPIFTTNVTGVLIVKLKCDDYGVIKIGDLAVTNSWPNMEYVKAWKVVEANSTNEVDIVWDSKGGSKWNFEYECYFYPEKPHLAITNNLWIGLDRTGNSEEPYVSSNIFAQAFITPSEITPEKVSWQSSGICDGRLEEDNALTLWTTNREVASASYRDQSIEATADGMKTLSDFTIVKVDVTIGEVGEDKEETEGAFVPYVADAPDGLLSEEGTNALVAVLIKCEPELPPNEVITISAPVGYLYLKENGLYVNVLDESFDLQVSRLKNVKLYLHGHNPSDSVGDRMVRVEHKKSGAKDCANITAVLFENIAVSCDKMPASGSFGDNPEIFSGPCLYFGQPDMHPPLWWLPGTKSNPKSKAFKVFYKYVKKEDQSLDNFIIKFNASIRPKNFLDYATIHWTQTSGPEEIKLSNVQGGYAEMENPKYTGLYKYRMTIEHKNVEVASEAWVLFPRAGGEISEWLDQEVPIAINRAKKWRNDVVKTALRAGEDPEDFLCTAWKYIASVAFDYQGVVGQPTSRYSYTDEDLPVSEQNGNDFDEPSYATLKGIVIHRAKINNLLYCVWGRELGYDTWQLRVGAYINALARLQWDNSQSQEAIILGGELYDMCINGRDLNFLITKENAKKMQTSDSDDGLNDVNLWPNNEISKIGFLFKEMPIDYETLQQGDQSSTDRASGRCAR